MTSVLRALFRTDSYNVLIYLSTTLHASHFKVSVVHSYRSFYQLIVYKNTQSRDKADTIFGEYVKRHPIHSQIICSLVINNFFTPNYLFIYFFLKMSKQVLMGGIFSGRVIQSKLGVRYIRSISSTRARSAHMYLYLIGIGSKVLFLEIRAR